MNIRALLEKKYGGEEWIFLEEVRDRPGFNAARSCDAVAMGLWMSRGCEVIGFEIKESRSDWLRELKAPEKAETAYNLCDRFYLATSKDVALIEEIPATWGWLEAHGSRLIEKKKAPLRPGSDGALDRLFVAMMLRRAKERHAKTDIIRDKAREMADADMTAERLRHQNTRSRLEENIKELEEEMRKVRAALGVYWPNYSEVAEVFKAMDHLRFRKKSNAEYTPEQSIEDAAVQLENEARKLRDCADAVKKFLSQATQAVKEEACTKPT